MKKILITLAFIFTLFSLTSCKYNVSRNKKVTVEEIEEYIEGLKNPFDESNVSFEYTSTIKTQRHSDTAKQEIVETYKIYGSYNSDNEGSINYNATSKSVLVQAKIDGKEKTSTNIKEEGVIFYRESSEDDRYYITIDIDSKIPYGKVKNKLLKTTLKEDAQLLSSVGAKLNSITSMLSTNNILSGDFFYLSNDKIKVVSSTSLRHIEKVFVLEDNEIVSYKVINKTTNEYQTTYTESELLIKNTKEVKVPKDAANYKTEYQQYEPGFFDNISFGLVLLIITIIAILVATLIIVLRIVKRPKYQEE